MISVQSWGGQESDYRPIHDFIDITKVLCPDSRHRILHTMWGVKEVIVPLFGHTLINSDGMEVDVKDMCERDHLLVDYGNKFIPTISDFVNAIELDDAGLLEKIERFHSSMHLDPKISDLLLSPLSVTGQVKSLLLTHNSWFINDIATKIAELPPYLTDFILTPSDLFDDMRFESWMDNGLTYPPSAQKLEKMTHRIKHG